MIKINLLEKNKPFRLPVVAGIDFNEIKFKLVLLGTIIYLIPDLFLPDFFASRQEKLNQQVEQLNKELTKINLENKKHKGSVDQLEVYKQQEARLVERSKQVEKIIKTRTNPWQVLEKLAKSTPDDLWFDQVVISSNKTIGIQGAALSYKSIGLFIASNNDSRFFGNTMKLGTSETKSIKVEGDPYRVETFSINGSIRSFDVWGE